MTNLLAWAEVANEKVDVNETLTALGYDESYISLMKRIFKINSTPVSKVSTTSYLAQNESFIRSKVDAAKMLSFTHTGQEVYPFGRSTLQKLNRIASEDCVLLGSTASNCVSTFKVFNMHMRGREKNKHVVMTCDTVFTNIMKEIPSTTVAGDARSFVVLDEKIEPSTNQAQNTYQIAHIASATYSEHFGGAWEESECRKKYEKEYTGRIVSLIQGAVDELNIDSKKSILVLPHNVNVYTWNAIGKKLNRANTEIYTQGMSDLGHCFGSDAFINLALAENDTDKQSELSDYIFCVTAGVGGFFSLIVLSNSQA